LEQQENNRCKIFYLYLQESIICQPKNKNMTLLGVIGAAELMVILIIGLIFLLLPIIALVDIIKSKFEGNLQIVWVIVVVCFNFIGAILYFIIGRNQKLQ